MSDYGELRKAAVKARNALNKQRSRQMEQRVAKFLRGDRVPMSGAGSIKGDVDIHTPHGRLLIECKCTAQTDVNYTPTMYIRFEWLKELDKDVNSMRSKFGALIIHYHKQRPDFVFIKQEIYEYLSPGLHTYNVLDKSKTGSWRVTKKHIEDRLKSGVFCLLTKFGSYVIITIDEFRDLLYNGSPS